VFSTFASSIADGMVPNRFDDYAPTAHYNSIDASLWFILAADRYVAAGGDQKFWRDVLMPATDAILTAYRNGTRFDIHADADGLLTGGAHPNPPTPVDAKLGVEVITPRHGKAVEVNALWHFAHRMMSERCRGLDDNLAEHYAHHAELIGLAFVREFWNAHAGCLYDCVHDVSRDGSIRPNQVFAVSLPHSPLSTQQQRDVMKVVTLKLLTPYGLRTLAPDDPRYRRGYGNSWESRDRAYHQGTVWAWLIGPYIEAYLRLEGGRSFGVARAKELLAAFDKHLGQAGLGYVSEIFDGDAPHEARGCIAQAWSVAEVLRAKMLVAEYEARLRS
jgi:predicted glycogen debranching enzyme